LRREGHLLSALLLILFVRMLGKSSSKPKAKPPKGVSVDQRYLKGRSELQSLFFDIGKSKRNWQILAFMSTGLSLVLGIGLVGVASQSRVQPFIVEVDKLGQARGYELAEVMREPAERLMVSQLTHFVGNLRTVTVDPVLQRDMISKGYAFVSEDASRFLNEYYSDPTKNPLTLVVRLFGKLRLQVFFVCLSRILGKLNGMSSRWVFERVLVNLFVLAGKGFLLFRLCRRRMSSVLF
jgi:hypothetical protein